MIVSASNNLVGAMRQRSFAESTRSKVDVSRVTLVLFKARNSAPKAVLGLKAPRRSTKIATGTGAAELLREMDVESKVQGNPTWR